MPDPWQQDYRLNKDELITYRYSVVLVEVQSGVCSDRQKIPVLPRGLDECGLKENRTYLVAGGSEDTDLKWRVGWPRMEQSPLD